ncbi:YraN family protein [Candidatus Gottesmanbacteria bacterium]|nr:YraN family protein [Candidatus Gottesmanbacteria bacterium]
MPKHQNLPKGRLGEVIAEKFLIHHGYRIITRNFKGRYGEIDIIATKKNTLIFIEVKTRWSNEYGSPEEAVTYWKLNSITRTAQYFKLTHPKLPESMQIDVVSVELGDENKLLRLHHLQNVTG